MALLVSAPEDAVRQRILFTTLSGNIHTRKMLSSCNDEKILFLRVAICVSEMPARGKTKGGDGEKFNRRESPCEGYEKAVRDGAGTAHAAVLNLPSVPAASRPAMRRDEAVGPRLEAPLYSLVFIEQRPEAPVHAS
ncbi:hypothetical protein [Martelella radicis]|uniref:Uncharacterized protein n=1 Tax=Martelella radicis TaxID=1397476 RepID=A0A7W6KHS6_9HYPH|nr:hypothetical protein [Martelella radicis]MBB4121335.1 hypothetical protein [Martelella radicis]